MYATHSYKIRKYICQILGVDTRMIEMIKPMHIAKGVRMKIIIFDSDDEKTNNFVKVLNAWNLNGGVPKMLQKAWNLSDIPSIRMNGSGDGNMGDSEHSLQTEKGDNFIYGVSECLENEIGGKESPKETIADIEHSESKILHTAELMRVGTSEYIKDFVEMPPERGHKITSSALGDLTRHSSENSETDRDSETEEGDSDVVDVQIERLMDALQKHRDGNEEKLDVSITIPTHHEHMASYDDVMNAINEMNRMHGIA